MNETIFTLSNHPITAWQIVGFLGTVMFSLRWVVQLVISRREKTSVIPISFWYISASGSCLLLLYFTFGAKDPVGIVSNLFPLIIAICNLFLFLKYKIDDKKGR